MFLNFVVVVQWQFNQVVKIIQSDNGTEFNCLQGYFFKHELVFESSCTCWDSPTKWASGT